MDDSTGDEREDVDLVLIKRHVAQLSEHFDTVHIFTTRVESDGTVSCNYGEGNWFARYGQMRTWLIKEDHAFREPSQADD